MLQRLDKSWPYILTLLLGYMTYTAMDQGNVGLAKGKLLPGISESMLKPKLIEPKGHASPADRDPFEVEWASYLDHSEDPGPTSQPVSTSTAPAASSPPPLAARLLAVFCRRDLRVAVIGEEVCKVGSTIGGNDPNTCWQVVAIGKDAVVVKFGKVQRVLRIARPPVPTSMPATDGE
jgi:hypothetical protein